VSIFWPRRPRRPVRPQDEQRYSFQAWVNDVMKFGGNTYPLTGNSVVQSWDGTPVEKIASNFAGHVSGGYMNDGVVFGVELKRLLIFSEARFQWRARNNGRPGDLFGTSELGILETPWVGGTTGDMLARMILDADMAGNSYWARLGEEMIRLRPDWVDIILAPRWAVTSQTGRAVETVEGTDGARQVGYKRVGYFYHQDGKQDSCMAFLADEIAHFAPIPDPLATYRGMSWLTPVIREIQADKQATDHQIAYLEHGGSPNFLIKLPAETTRQQFNLFKEAYEASHGSIDDAYGTLLLTAGADATILGSTMRDLDMKALRGQGETRIAMAGGIHPVVLGSSDGMAGSSLNAGNYTAAKRSTADGTFRPLWRNACSSLAPLLTPPRTDGSVELWYDDRDVAFLREDQRDQADIASKEAQTIRNLIDAGFEAESVKAAVIAGDWSLLKHSGLFSVQLQKPESGTQTSAA
jgi:hypothetical protein